MPNIYVFSSKNLTNIWAGIGAGMWAVSEKQSENASIRTKSQSLPIGALGLFYCVEGQLLTTPFLVVSQPDITASIDHIWPEEWYLPFQIQPLGAPHHRVPKDKLSGVIPSLRQRQIDWTRLFYVTPMMAFTPSVLTDSDWDGLVRLLVPQRQQT